MAYVPPYIYIYIYIYIYRTSSNLYTPDSVSLASLARQLISTELLGGVRNWRASEASETLLALSLQENDGKGSPG